MERYSFGLRQIPAILLFAAAAALASPQEGPRVLSFTPTGEVREVRQVRVRFSHPMVPFGDPLARVDIFEIDCPSTGTPRWADSNNWIFDFKDDLNAGVRCRFRLRSDVRSQSGEALSGPTEFSFNTGGPAILRSSPYEGSSWVREDQVFELYLNGVATPESILENVYFVAEGITERIGVRIVRNSPETRNVAIQALLHFPSSSGIQLVWGEGVETANGVPSSQNQILHYKIRAPFTANLHCLRENARSDCVPVGRVALNFSASFSVDLARRIRLRSEDGRQWEATPTNSSNSTYSVFFPRPLPAETDFVIELPAGFRDDSGRPLVNQNRFPLAFKTAPLPPLAKFPATFGIIESKADPVLPVTLRRVEDPVNAASARLDPGSSITGGARRIGPRQVRELISWMIRLDEGEWNSRESSVFANGQPVHRFEVPKPNGAEAFEVVGIPLPESGFYLVELKSDLLGASLLDLPPKPMYVRTGALVTNMAVHFKRGRESSLAWVTSLDSGRPLADAEVGVWTCGGNRIWSGTTDDQGIVRFGSLEERYPSCGPPHTPHNGGHFIVAQKGDDLSFTHTSWTEGIELWRFQIPFETWRSPTPRSHTVFGRTLLRAGEKVHMKHVLRRGTMDGFSLVSNDNQPQGLLIRHRGSNQQFQMPLQWSGNGTAVTEWEIPKDAKLGSYQTSFIQRLGENPGYELFSGEFRVEEFRLPLATGSIFAQGLPLVSPDSMDLQLSVRYLAGGPAGGLPIKLRHQLLTRALPEFEGFSGFRFANGPVKPGTRRLPSVEPPSEPHSRDLNLNRQGTARARIEELPELEIPMQMLAEMEYYDPSGEVQTISTRVPLWPTRQLVGIKPDQWFSAADSLAFTVAAIDLNGKPIADAEISVDLYEGRIYSSRKRLVGGFYSFEHFNEVKLAAEAICTGRTDDNGRLYCQAESPATGRLILAARLSKDGETSHSHREIWVAGEEDWWFEAQDHERMDVLPLKTRYEPGESARFQVRSPFRQATALVTVEREGVIDAYVQPIRGKEPIVEIPVKGAYSPNAFVSVLAVRGRVGDVQPTALIDLGRPTYRLGIAEIKVGWRDHTLNVKVRPQRRTYRVRETAEVEIEVESADGSALSGGSEVAVAAVDEALLELRPNLSWDLLSAMMGRRPSEVETSTAQMQVVGKRHYGLKARPQGGGGGQQRTRELFDTLLFWDGRVRLDSQGRARVRIPLNDSLTTFRIAAVANDDVQRFGTGSTAIRTTQDLMVLSGVAPVVREGDRFQAEFTVRNASEGRMRIEIEATIEPLRDEVEPHSITLQAGEARTVSWDIDVPLDVDTLRYTVSARSPHASDSLTVDQKIVPSVPVRTYQATLFQLADARRIPLESPKGALPGRGGVDVELNRSVLHGLDSVLDFMGRYPYSCLEQRLSKAVALDDRDLFDGLMERLPAYLDSDGLAKFFPSLPRGSDILTSYLLAVAHEAGWPIPSQPLSRMQMGLERFVQGRLSRPLPLPSASLDTRKLAAIEALSRYGRARAQLVGSLTIQPNLWPSSALLDWIGILRRVPNIPDSQVRLGAANQILLARLNFQGTLMGFSTEETDYLWWQLCSIDSNAARVILTLIDQPELESDMPRLVRGALERRQQGHWQTTPANAWGMLAMRKFAKRFESSPVTGTTEARLGEGERIHDWNAGPGGVDLSFAWPQSPSELSLRHDGQGRPWAAIESKAALPLQAPVSSGYRIRKTWEAVDRERPDAWSKGDVVRVRLEIDAQADRTWVVVDDPIPAGAVVLGGGLGRDSAILTGGESDGGLAWKAFEERSFEGYRIYYSWVPKGAFTVEYTLRLNQAGRYQLPNTRVESMYSPEMFGEIPNTEVQVVP